MTDPERRAIAQQALDEHFAEGRDPDPELKAQDELLIRWMIRLMHLNPVYEDPENVAWILRLLYYLHVIKLDMLRDYKPDPDTAQWLIDELEKSPTGLSREQALQDIRETSPFRAN